MSEDKTQETTPEEETKEEKAPEATPETPEVTPEEAPKEEAPAEETPAEEPKEDAAAEAPAEEVTEEVPSEEAAEPTPDAVEEMTATDEETVVEELPHRDIKPGMVVRVHEVIKDISPKGEERKRTQIFEGMVLNIRGKGVSRTMTVRKVSKGYGVEKIYPLAVPSIEKIEVVKRYKVRRANIGFLKGIIKRGRVKRRFTRKLKEIK